MSDEGALVQPETALIRKQPQTHPVFQSCQAEQLDRSIAPVRPVLAPNAELGGELQGSGHQDHQWLVNPGDRPI